MNLFCDLKPGWSPVVTMVKYNSIIIRYDEIGLKGKNRRFFEQRLVDNLRAAITEKLPAKESAGFRFRIVRGRIVIESEEILPEIFEGISCTFGVSSFSPAVKIHPSPDMIKEIGLELVRGKIEEAPLRGREHIRFRVNTTRANKAFPLNSMELDREVADHILPVCGRLKVDLTGAELILGIDLRDDVYLFVERIEGLRGLPVGTAGTMLALLSGGIDSPVASYKMMRRGARIDFINYHSPPYIGEESKGKIKELAKALRKFQGSARVYIVNFTEFQTQIKLNCEERLRTILYRRAMMRIASELAKTYDHLALVTGESLGQVASQTIPNITSIEDAASIPVMRPLIAYEKIETIEIAKRIGTFDISILPYPDSCTVFAPLRPAISTTVAECVKQEERLDYDALLKKAVDSVEVLDLHR